MTVAVFILVCLIWGSTWLAIKIGVVDAPPLMAVSLRFILSGLILLVIVKSKGLKLPSTFKRFVILGCPGLLFYTFCHPLVYIAEQRINSATTGVIFGSIPFVVALYSWFIYKAERLTIKGWIGLIIGLLGVGIISADLLSVSERMFSGSILVILAVLSTSLGTVVQRRHFANENFIVSATTQIILGGSIITVVSLITEDWSSFQFNTANVGSILYLAIIGTVVAFLGYYWLISKMDAVRVALTAYVIPLITILIGITLGNETLSGTFFIGVAFILSAIFLVVQKSRPDMIASPKKI